MIAIIIVFLIDTVTSQYLHYDCYGSGLMDANCSDTQQIYPVGVKVGTKEATLNCSKEYTPELNWTMIEFDRCCKPDPGDLCVGDYVNVGNPLNTFIFYEYCIGRSSCRILQVQRVDTLYLNCDQTLYYAQTTFMAMEYDCIDESKILTINANKGVSSEPGGSVHLQGHDYLVPSISSTITTSSCSIETPSCDSTISIEVLDLRLASDGSDCKQTVTILYGYRITNFTCVNNINFTRFTVGSEHNYLNVTFSNSMTSNGGHFWLGFRGTRSDVIRIDCPAKLPVTDCNFTTTTEPTTTTEIHTTTELDTTTYEVEMTTTELDTSTTVSDTTSIESLTTNSSPDKNSSQLNTTIIGVAANPTSPPEKTANEEFIYIVVGIVLAGLMIFTVVACYCCKKKKQGKINPKNTTENKIQNGTEKEKILHEKKDENKNNFESESKGRETNTINDSDKKLSKDNQIDYTSEGFINLLSAREIDTCYIENESKYKKKKKKKKLAKQKKERKHSSENIDEKERTPQNEVAVKGVSESTSIDLINPADHSQNKQKKKKKKRKQFKHDEDTSIDLINPADHSQNKQKKKKKKRKQFKHDEDFEIAKDFEENIEISQTDDAVGYEHKLTLRDDFVESIEANSRDMKKTKKKKRKKKKGLDLDDEIIDEENHRKIKKKKKKHGREIDETNDDHNLTTNDI